MNSDNVDFVTWFVLGYTWIKSALPSPPRFAKFYLVSLLLAV